MNSSEHELWNHTNLASNLSSATHQQCDLEQALLSLNFLHAA
jgi:hypothetical protein